MAAILVVDEGYALQSVMDGRAALAALRCQPFDLALVDILLPGFSGLDLLSRLKEHGPAMPVILITCRQDADAILQALRAGVCDCVARPFDLEYLRATVRRVLAECPPPLAQACHRACVGQTGGCLADCSRGVGLGARFCCGDGLCWWHSPAEKWWISLIDGPPRVW